MQRQWREIGESGWMDCNEDWFNYCNKSALHDTRSIPKHKIEPNNYQDRSSESQKEWLGK
jgi:hypothetical protein